ncbi:hypothetical protein HN51_071639 [Arachis hypogaea]|uniref:C2 NT-type domain-containing protein n=1 Tax=Arachis hypogaea TaxID=3818 RepID=A0A444YXP1_ARAHY|nr:paramyosin-like isoform X1 [Arachis ipaensis]XP_025656828.1 paramyosin [Arachis hypogaea]RYR06707.1 hypothetical protein Ahy_B05g074011 [Arachis hypogaea]
MFRSWSKKNKIKAVFKLQFQATQVPKMKKPALMIALVPDGAGKPTVKLEKVAIQGGSCLWDKPIFETVKFVRDTKSGKLHEKIYHFIVSTGSSKSGFLGEASVDFADFAAETEPLTISLPLKFANSGAILHVTIQNIEGYTDQSFRNGVDGGGGSLKHQQSNCSTDDSSYNAEDSSRLLLLPPPIRTTSMPSNGRVEVPASETHRHRRSNTEVSTGSASDGNLGDWTNSLEDNLPRERLLIGPPDSTTENLKTEIASLKRQVEVSEQEHQSLQKQLEKESIRGQNMARQIILLREERNMLKTKYEQLNSQQNLDNENKASKSLPSEIEDTRLQLEALKEELIHEKSFSASLRSQLQKTQDSNSELLSAVRELEAVLELKNKEILDQIDKHSDWTEIDLLRQKIADQNREIDTYSQQLDELNEHIEVLTSDYELLKRENLDICLRLKKVEAQHKMLQNKHSASLTAIEQLESQVEILEEKIKNREEEFSESLVYINELENQVNNLERELQTQADKFEEDLHSLKCAKIEQEEQAMKAEEALRMMTRNNALISERFQDEFRRLSVEMASKVEENEKMIVKANAEADELQKQNKLMEETLQKCNQELRLITNQNDLKLQELLNQINSKEKTVEMLTQELEGKSKQLENVQSQKDEKDHALSKQIQVLRIEIKKLMVEKHAFSKAKPTEQMTEVVLQGNQDVDKILGTLMTEVEILKNHHNELTNILQKEHAEKENMCKTISQLEGELKKKEAELSIMEKKQRNNKRQPAAANMNMTPRDSERCGASPSNEEQLKTSNSEWHKGMDAGNTADGLEEKGIGNLAEKKVCQALHRSDAKTCLANEVILFNHDHSGRCHTNELLNEVALLKERNKYMENELKELEERYSDISLKFAEVEGERQQLVMALRSIKNGKNLNS